MGLLIARLTLLGLRTEKLTPTGEDYSDGQCVVEGLYTLESRLQRKNSYDTAATRSTCMILPGAHAARRRLTNTKIYTYH